uniref:WAT1-related protein n=1 Tax=Kalanchoe fedtschenkoi TaxID=63787 RepID=A0A7N0UIT7_KALFE
MNFFSKFKFHFLIFLGNVGCVFTYFITISSFDHGLRPEVYSTYRLAIGSFAVLPFAFFKDRARLPKLTAGFLCKIFLLSLLGTSLPIITFYEGMRCTSPTVASAVNNTIPSTVFVLAVLRGMETLKIRSRRGMAKVAGSVLSLAGVTIMTLYKGYELKPFDSAPIRMEQKKIQEQWVKGSALVAISCVSYSFSFILQAMMLKKYPAQLSLAVWMNVIGSAMSAVFAGAITLHDPNAWALGLDIRLWSVLYGGIFASGYLIFVQLWCTKEKGAVFMTMFYPLTTLMSAFVSYFLVGSNLYVGSILGAVVVVVGLYCLLWGKTADQNDNAPLPKQLQAVVNNGTPEEQVDKVAITVEETPDAARI